MSNEGMRQKEMTPKYPDGRLSIIDGNINRNTHNFKLLRKSYVLSLVIPFFLGIWCIFHLIGCTSKMSVNPATEYNSKGLEKVNRKDYEGAIKDFSKAIQHNRNFAMAYYNRGVILRQLDQGSYWAAKRDFSTALTLAEQQKDKSVIDRIKQLDVDVHSHHIFDGDSAIRKLKEYRYQIHRIDGGYKLTKIETGLRTRTTKDGTVVTGKYISGKYEHTCHDGLLGKSLMERGVEWSVDRNGRIWLAVLNVIVISAN